MIFSILAGILYALILARLGYDITDAEYWLSMPILILIIVFKTIITGE